MEPTNSAREESRPDTYFLQRAVNLGLDSIAARLDQADGCRPFFWVKLSPHPLLEHDIWDLGDMCSRYVDAFVLGRQVTGSTRHAAEEAALRRLLPACDPYVEPFMATRKLISLVDLHLQEPCPETRKPVTDLVRLIRSRMTVEADYAFLFKPPAGWSSLTQPLGSFTPYPTYPVGGIILALARLLEEGPDPDAEDLLDRLCRFVLRESGTFTPDGRYFGHTHSGGILTAAAGIMRWALRRGDAAVVEQMRNALEWTLLFSSSWGWVPDGVGELHGSSESCSIADFIHLALLAARGVDPAYYDVVERTARNQLLENQFRDPDRALPVGDFPGRARISAALKGSWASWSLPNALDNCLAHVEGCCLGAGVRACFLAWDGVISCERDTVRVNMALSRSSLWAEVISYLPFQGRLDILMHQEKQLRVRLPGWVGQEQARLSVDGRPVPLRPAPDRYLPVDGLKPGSRVRLDFPLQEQTTEERVSGTPYRVRWRGNTVVSISPRAPRYPLYEREWMEGGKAPLLAAAPYLRQQGGPVHW